MDTCRSPRVVDWMQKNTPISRSDFRLALVLSGGNALGAYQAGAYQYLHEHGLEPDWIAGASAGAMNGAVICGNPREHRLGRLRAFWHVADLGGMTTEALPVAADKVRRTQVASATLASGQVDWFTPRAIFGPWWNVLPGSEPASMYDSSPIESRLSELLDFDLLNAGTPRFSATAVDVETGEDIVYATGTHRFTPRHLRACGALMPAFPPLEVDGRLIADAGTSANLPLDTVLSAQFDRPLMCIAIDLLPLHAPRPQTLGETVTRAQDLIFAAQSRRGIAAWQAIHAERTKLGATGSLTLLHVSYTEQSREVSGKAFDFSRLSAEARWRAGFADMERTLKAAQVLPFGEPGLAVHALGSGEDADQLQRVEWELAPVPA